MVPIAQLQELQVNQLAQSPSFRSMNVGSVLLQEFHELAVMSVLSCEED
jgi:hypothetical protein